MDADAEYRSTNSFVLGGTYFTRQIIGEDIRNQYIYVVRVIARASVCVNSISELIMI